MIIGYGWIKGWRRQILHDLQLDAKTLKVWMLLQCLAFHAPRRGLPSGGVRASYGSLQWYLREYHTQEKVPYGDSFRTYSEGTLKRCLDRLVETGRISRETAKKGLKGQYYITNWLQMQRGDWDSRLAASGVGQEHARGFLKLWRRQVWADLGLDDKTFKLWLLLNVLATYSPKQGVQPGEALISTPELADYLSGSLKESYTDESLHESLGKLAGYITVEKGNRPFSKRIRIKDWDRMQTGNWDEVMDEDFPLELQSTYNE